MKFEIEGKHQFHAGMYMSLKGYTDYVPVKSFAILYQVLLVLKVKVAIL